MKKPMSFTTKKTIALLILVTFLASVFFGAFEMTHRSDGSMLGDCPFSFVETINCLQNTIASAVHHIFSYQSFLNITANFGLMAILALLLVSISLLFEFFIKPNLPDRLIKKRFQDSLQAFQSIRKITRWLSLFEHSPSQYLSA